MPEELATDPFPRSPRPEALPTVAFTTDPPEPPTMPPAGSPVRVPGVVPTWKPGTEAAAETASVMAPPGYEILGELGRGGMGVVYKARHVGLNRIVALKCILAGNHAGKADQARFRQEAEAVARLQHPGIVQIYDIGVHNGVPFFSLEFCAGGSLADKLQGKPLPSRQAAELLRALAEAVHAAHQAGIVHRDLKPGNILLQPQGLQSLGLDQSGGLGIPKITDFGLAKIHDVRKGSQGVLAQSGLTQTGVIMGTPSYMAPEQAEGRTRDIGPACDVYGLGALLYEMLTGRPPFLAATHLDTVSQVLNQEPLPPRMLNRQIDSDLEKITLKCLEKQPEQRYTSAADLAEDLRRYLAGEPITARSVNLLERLQRELAHSQHDTYLRPWGVGLMLLGLLIFLAHLATSLLLWAGLPQMLCFWGPRSVLLAALVPLLLRYRPRGAIWPTNAVERLIYAVWIGYLLTFLSLFWVMHILHHDHLQIYGVAAAVSGLAWFTMGGYVWGGCYLIGWAFLLLAPGLALFSGSPWSPFCFGVMWSAALLTLGLRYWKLGQTQ